ncbi:MAG: hypothetical protein R3C44_24605 [Chloroflexota bacterium]
MNSDTYTYNGETYRRQGDEWINAATWLKPPLVIARELDRQFGRPANPTTNTPSVKRATPRAPGKPGRDFTGLAETDFSGNIAGTSWRKKTSLGGMLAQRLADITGRPFLSNVVSRRTMVLIGQPPRFDSNNVDKINLRKAKFYFRLNETGANYGFYIEKEDKPMDDSWEWPTFLKALRETAVTSAVEQAMVDHDLAWFVQHYEGSKDGPRSDLNFVLGDPLIQQMAEGERPITWSDLAGRLDEAAPLDWYDVFLRRQLSRDEAMALGAKIVEPVVDVFRPLIPLYNACAG